MPGLSEESLWHWGCLTQFLERHRGASTKGCGGCLGFWFECSSPLLKFLLPSQLLEVKQGYSPSAFFFTSSLVPLPQSPSGGSSLSMCGVWVFGMQGVCLECSMPEEKNPQGLGWMAAALKFIKQGCSRQICRNGKAPLVLVRQSLQENEPEVTIFTPGY